MFNSRDLFCFNSPKTNIYTQDMFRADEDNLYFARSWQEDSSLQIIQQMQYNTTVS